MPIITQRICFREKFYLLNILKMEPNMAENDKNRKSSRSDVGARDEDRP